MYFLVVISILACLIPLGLTAKLPSQFKKCKSNDRECLKVAIQDAIRKLGEGLPNARLSPLNPLIIPEMTVGAGKSVVNVQQHYKDVKIWGSNTATVTDAEIDLEKRILRLDLSYPEIKMEAKYTMMGQILVLPVVGDGLCSIILENAKPTFDAKFEILTKSGKQYIKINSQTYRINASFAKYHFDNIFKGDKRLGDEINKVLNENWKEIYDEVVPGYEAAVGMLLANIANRFFAKVPISEIFVQ